ncbi:NTP transferase domain-containing protein [Gemmatimonadota bacterium]
MKTAVILAAGMGTRLEGALSPPGTPKGLIEVGGSTLLDRSIDLLVRRCIEKVILVVGYRKKAFEPLAQRHPVVTLVSNENYRDSGSMASLARAIPHVHGDFLLLESDLLFEARALDAVLDHGHPDVVLASSPTGATDEVWVEAENGKLVNLAKADPAPPWAFGEFVGICRVSEAAAERMADLFNRWVEARGDERMDYETDGLVGCASVRPITVHRVEDLVWGEVDHQIHYDRLIGEVWPRISTDELRPEGGGRS